MTKYQAMQARARKAGLWPISKEQAYYAGLEEGAAVADRAISEIQAEAVDAALRNYAQQWVEPQVKGPFLRELVHADIIEHADRLADMRNGEDNE